MTALSKIETRLIERVEKKTHQSDVRKDLVALSIPLLFLAVQIVRIVAIGTIYYTPNHASPVFGHGDLYRYIAMASPEVSQYTFEPPFLYRILVPLMAHGLLFLGVPLTIGFFAITITALTVSTVAIYFLVRGCQLSRLEASLAAIAYLTLYWAVAMNVYDYFLIDATDQAFLVCILLAIQRRKFPMAIVLSTIGIICNERILFGIAVGVIQLLFPYLRPIPLTLSMLVRLRFRTIWKLAPVGVWLNFAGLLVFPGIALAIVHIIQHPSFNIPLLVEMQEYISMHFPHGYSFQQLDYLFNGGTLDTFGPFFMVAIWAVLLRVWPRTRFTGWSYLAGVLIILLSFTLSGDVMRLTILGWPFILMASAVALHEIGRRLSIPAAALWIAMIIANMFMQISRFVQLVPHRYWQFFHIYGLNTTLYITAVLSALVLLAVLRSPGWAWEARKPTLMPVISVDDRSAISLTDSAEQAELAQIKTMQVPAIIPQPLHKQHSDETFWQSLSCGLVALQHLDLWVAHRILQEVTVTIVEPFAQRVHAQTGGDFSVPPPWRPNSLGSLTQAYRITIQRYQHLRHLAHLVATAPAKEAGIIALLNTIPSQIPENSPTGHLGNHLSIILPAYNEEAVIAQTVFHCLDVLEHIHSNFEIIVVDDGSRDQTGAIADGLAANDGRVVVVHNQPNRGYGGAVVAGFTAARGDLVFFMDSDGQFDIHDIALLLEQEQHHPGAAIIGYRHARRDPFLRKLNAGGWKRLVRLVVGLRGVRDIDCAFKLLPTPVVRACRIQSQGAMVNTELLVKIQRMHVPIIQVPVQHLPRVHGKATGANLRVILRAFRELMRLRARLRKWQPGVR